LLLYSAFWWEFRELRDTQQNISWSDVFLLSLGAVCQQGDRDFISYIFKCLFFFFAILINHYFVFPFLGSTLEARGVCGRAISIMLYITVIFLYTSYSACIVALLQSTTDSIRTLQDLYQSGMGLGALDIVYSRHYFSVTSVKQFSYFSIAHNPWTVNICKCRWLQYWATRWKDARSFLEIFY
jgi:hypothetical protein